MTRPGPYTASCNDAIRVIEQESELATMRDYYRAQSYKELAIRFARFADVANSESNQWKLNALDVRTALGALEGAHADALTETQVAWLADMLLKFLADRTTPCAWDGRGLGMEHITTALNSYLREACKTNPYDLLERRAA